MRILLFCLILVLCSAGAYACLLVDGGRAAAAIVLGADATEPEKNAARELQSYVEKISGARLDIVPEPSKELNNVFVGQTELTRKQIPDFDWDSLKRDGILVRNGKKTLILAGDRPAGTLYAVYDFLEKDLGVRFWAPGEESVPEASDIKAKADRVYTPPFYLREDFFRQYMHDERFKAKHKLNGRTNLSTASISPEWGGCYDLIGGGHTFWLFLNPSEYFADHPEWFSLINGERFSGYGQLCLSNDECVDMLTQKVLEELRKHPDPRMISVTQNDNMNYCRCDKCTALAEKYGAQSGVILHAVNRVARAVKKEFPGVLVETFAYQYSVDAPSGIRPEDNVMVRLCNIYNDFGTPLRDCPSSPYPDRVKVNLDYLKAIDKWHGLTDNLFIWNYVVNFTASYLMHPNFFCLKPDLQTFRDNGAGAVFEQGDAFNNDCAFTLLKAYMAAELMWDPEADDDALMKEFLAGYYGDAWPMLYKVIRLNEDWQREAEAPLVCFSRSCFWLTKDRFNECMGLFAEALAAVSGDRRERVLEEALCFQYSMTRIDELGQEEWAACGNSLYRDAERFEKFFLAFQKKTGNAFSREGGAYTGSDAVREGEHLSPAVLPEALKGLGPEEYFCMPGTDFDLYLAGSACDMKEDSLSPEGKAGVQYTNTSEWGLQRKVSKVIGGAYKAGYKKARMFVSARAGGKRTPGKDAFQLYFWDFNLGTKYIHAVSADLLSEDKYTVLDCGAMDLWGARDVNLCIVPLDNEAVEGGVWVDKVYMIFEK